MINTGKNLSAQDFEDRFSSFWDLSAAKIKRIETSFDTSKGAPVFTVAGKYSTRGWTEWTQGFQFGAGILQFDATGDEYFLDYATRNTIELMASHVTHIGVHDHGFNNVSTYGGLLRLMNGGKIAENSWQRHFLEIALKASGCAQASRWTNTSDGLGYVYSFNGPHSLFSDTARTIRSLFLADQLGHYLSIDNDVKVSLFERGIKHLLATAKHNVYYGEGRDGYDQKGRVVHESIFNTNDGNYRCASTQQGYSPFTTWTRGQAWVITGFAEQLEYLKTVESSRFESFGSKELVMETLVNSCIACSDHFIENTADHGVPWWDTGAAEGDRPLDSSASAIAAQGLLRLANVIGAKGEKYKQAAFTMLDTLLSDEFLSTSENHEGLLLHSVYHWPNRWDHVPEGDSVAAGEATMWGDYHLRELMLFVQRIANDEPYLKFYI